MIWAALLAEDPSHIVLRFAVKAVVMCGFAYLVRLLFRSLFRKKNGEEKDGKDKP